MISAAFAVVCFEGFAVPVERWVFVHSSSAPPAWCAIYVVIEEAFALDLMPVAETASSGVRLAVCHTRSPPWVYSWFMSKELSAHARSHLSDVVRGEGLPSPEFEVRDGRVIVLFQDPAFQEVKGLLLQKSFPLEQLEDPSSTGLANAASALLSEIRLHRNPNW